MSRSFQTFLFETQGCKRINPLADKPAADKPAAAFHEAMQVKVYNMLIEINICFGYNKCTISGRRHAGVWLRKGIQARVEGAGL